MIVCGYIVWLHKTYLFRHTKTRPSIATPSRMPMTTPRKMARTRPWGSANGSPDIPSGKMVPAAYGHWWYRGSVTHKYYYQRSLVLWGSEMGKVEITDLCYSCRGRPPMSCPGTTGTRSPLTCCTVPWRSRPRYAHSHQMAP